MLYMCKECGGLVAGPKEIKKEYELDGRVVTITETVCPHCGGELVDTCECEICGKVIPDDDTICPECKAKIATYDNACELGDHDKKTYEINGFIATFFDERDVEDILFDTVGRYHIDIEEEARKYFEADPTRYEDYYFFKKRMLEKQAEAERCKSKN